MKTQSRISRASLLALGLSIAVGVTAVISAQAQGRTDIRVPEPIIGGPCEGCEGVFDGLPATLFSVTRIARPGEPGQPMVISGIVRDQHGTPIEGIIVYAYQTDADGIYRPEENASGSSARRHGQLRDWAMTDSLGRYRFITIRPGHYPQRNAPQHVHMHVIEPGCCTYYIASIQFRDDPLLSDATRRAADTDRGGSGLTDPRRSANGTWQVHRDIRLGAGIPGYSEVRRRRR